MSWKDMMQSLRSYESEWMQAFDHVFTLRQEHSSASGTLAWPFWACLCLRQEPCCTLETFTWPFLQNMWVNSFSVLRWVTTWQGLGCVTERCSHVGTTRIIRVRVKASIWCLWFISGTFTVLCRQVNFTALPKTHGSSCFQFWGGSQAGKVLAMSWKGLVV